MSSAGYRPPQTVPPWPLRRDRTRTHPRTTPLRRSPPTEATNRRDRQRWAQHLSRRMHIMSPGRGCDESPAEASPRTGGQTTRCRPDDIAPAHRRGRSRVVWNASATGDAGRGETTVGRVEPERRSEERRTMIEYAACVDPAILSIAELSRTLDQVNHQQALAANARLSSTVRSNAARKARQVQRRINAHTDARKRELQNASALARFTATHQEPEQMEYMPTTPMRAPSSPASSPFMMTVNSGRGTWNR